MPGRAPVPSPAPRSPIHRRVGGLLILPLSVAIGCIANPNKGAGDGDGGIVEATDSTLPPIALRLSESETTPRAPVQLTASDGTGLRLISMTARGVVEEPLAFTELHLVFENPNDRQIEGRFEIEMPPHAAISRFAMKVHGAWQEGEVVERQAARVAYEDFLHRKQDPALLENNAGNAFSARVFPIGPRERKELIVSYSQELPSSAEPYRLMLRGLPELDRLDARIIVREIAKATGASNLGGAAVDTRVVELTKSKYTPDRDLEVPTADANGRVRPLGLRHQNLAVARVAPSGAMPAAEVGALTVLFDTSASRALGFERQIARLKAVIDDLRARSEEDFDLRVVAFDQGTAELFQGKASAFTQAHLDRIASRRALGASDLEAALRSVAADPEGSTRLLVISDGISTAGSAELSRIEEATRLLAAAGIKRADAIVDGGIQDTTALKAMTTADLPDDGVVIDGRLPTATIAHKLGSAALPPIKVSVPGSAWVWPESIEGAQPGDEVLVYADIPADRAMKVVLAGENEITADVPTTSTERPLLERAWVRARIDRLASERSRLPEGDSDMRDALKRSIIDLSTKHRVLSDFTALLVLETEWDYQRFNIDRNALVDILSVGPHGITLDGRSQRPEAPALPEPAAGEHGLYAMKGPRDATPQMARNFDPDMAARQQGILGTLAQDSGHFLASPYGGAFAVGNDDSDIWGGLTGSEVGEAFGVGGLGLVGTGRGGGGVGEGSIGLSAAPAKESRGLVGGSGEGTIGLGNTGLIGRGGGGGTGSGYGRGSGAGFGGRGQRVPIVRQAKAQVEGALDKDIIRRIVRAHINEVRACYNQGLTRDPFLSGRVAVNFVISATGTVPSAVVQQSSLPDSRVGTCIAKAVRRWKFQSRGAAASRRVTYPFVLGSNGTRRPRVQRPAADPRGGGGAPAEEARQRAETRPPPRVGGRGGSAARPSARGGRGERSRTAASPFTGRFFDISARIEGDARAVEDALAWRPGRIEERLRADRPRQAAEALATGHRGPGLRLIIDLLPGARRPPRRYAGNRLEPDRRAADARRRPLRQGRRVAPRSPGEPPPLRPRPDQARRARAGLGGDPRRSQPRLPLGALRRRRQDLRRRRRADRRGLDPRPAGRGPADPRARREAARDRRRRPVDALRHHLGDRRQRRRLPRLRRQGEPRLLRRAHPALGRRALRRRDHRLRPRELHDQRRGRRVPLPRRGPLLQPRTDGLRHGQAADHPARRQGRPALRRAPLPHHEGPRVRQARHPGQGALAAPTT
ncbi:MAG: TonB family protein [Nannocystaceae bacterium]